jgi:hypothetical protein
MMPKLLHEELLGASGAAEPGLQSEIVRRSCGDIGKRIREARTRTEALEIVGALCASFEVECESEVMREFVRSYAEELVRKRWDALL